MAILSPRHAFTGNERNGNANRVVQLQTVASCCVTRGQLRHNDIKLTLTHMRSGHSVTGPESCSPGQHWINYDDPIFLRRARTFVASVIQITVGASCSESVSQTILCETLPAWWVTFKVARTKTRVQRCGDSERAWKKWEAEGSEQEASLHALWLYIWGYLHSSHLHSRRHTLTSKSVPPFFSITLAPPLQDTVHYLAPLEPEILGPIHIHSLTLFFMQNADSINKQSVLLLRANREDDSRLLRRSSNRENAGRGKTTL